MKVFLIACLAVAALAESDPNLILTNGMYHTGVYNTMYPYNSMVHPIVSPISYIQPTVQIQKEQEKQEEKKVEVTMKAAEEIKPIVYTSSPFINTYINPLRQVVVGPKVVQENGEVKSVLHKREAEADPWMVYNTAGVYGLPAVRPVVYNRPAVVANKATFYNPWTMDVTGKYSNDAVLPTNYAKKGQYFARAPGTNTVHVAKREADPLTVVSSPFMYSGLAQPIVSNPFVYSGLRPVVSSPVVYTNPTVVAKTMAEPITKNTPLGMEGVLDGKTVADDAWQFTPNYAGKGMYRAQTPGTDHRAKREADPLTIYRTGLYNSYYPSTYGVRSSLYSYSYPRTVVAGSPYMGYYY